MDPLIIVFYTFSIAFILVNLIYINKTKDLYVNIKTNFKYVLLINISTAIDWLLIFIALKFINASLINCFVFGVAPITTLMLSFGKYNSSKIFIKDFIICMLVMFILIGLSMAYYKNHIQSTSNFDLFLGVILSVASGVATGVTAYGSRLLYEKKFTTSMVVKSRYVVIILLTLTIILLKSISIEISLTKLLSLSLLSFLFIIIPAFLLQKGLEKILPVLAVVISSSIPVLTYLFQFIEPSFIIKINELIYVIMLSIVIGSTGIINKIMKV